MTGKTANDGPYYIYYHTAYELQKGLGVGWTMQALDERRFEKVLSRPWTADGQTFTGRCWKDKTRLVDVVNKELTRMIATGEAPDRAISAISHQMGVSKVNAGRLVMTESAFFASAAQKDCFNDLGVERYSVVQPLTNPPAVHAVIWTAKCSKWNGEKCFIPQFSLFSQITTIAGAGTDNLIQDVKRLEATYHIPFDKWKKQAGKVESSKYVFDIHWYEADDGIQHEPKLKNRKEKKNET